MVVGLMMIDEVLRVAFAARVGLVQGVGPRW
jgi:hypothetical protein